MLSLLGEKELEVQLELSMACVSGLPYFCSNSLSHTLTMVLMIVVAIRNDLELMSSSFIITSDF